VSERRALFLQAVEAVNPLLASPALTTGWDSPSALAQLSVRGLAGHLLRATGSVEAYLDRPEPPADQLITPETYYSTVVAETDLEGELHTAIRQRGEEAATGGPGTLAAAWRDTADRLRARFATEAPTRRLQVYQGMVLTLDDYLGTRLVELCVHVDDLAVSLGQAAPPLPEAATGWAVQILVDVARLRHGDAAVLRALTRRERDSVGALRVL
jgi:hypothetical protein